MLPDPLFYKLVLVVLVWRCVMLHLLWPSERVAARPTPPQPVPPPHTRSKAPDPFAGFTRQPHCDGGEPATEVPPLPPPPAPPPVLIHTRGCPRQVASAAQCCPNPDWAYDGRAGSGNLHANGHPSGRPWRQWHCVKCGAYVLETYSTPFHGKRVSPDLLVWAVGALAEGLGIRAVARVFEVDPNPGLSWLVAATDHLEACSQYCLHDVRVTQVQLDELYALLSAVKDGEGSEAEALKRLSRSPHWGGDGD